MSGMYGAAPGNTLTIPSVAPPSYPVASAGAPPPSSSALPSGVGSLADYLAGAGGGAGATGGMSMGGGGGLGSLLGGGGLGGGGGGGGLLALLSGLFGGGGGMGGGLGLGGLSTLGSTFGTGIGNLLDPLFGINQGGSSAMGGNIGGLAGGAIGSIFGPLGTLGGSALGSLFGDLLGGWIGGGLPEMAKPQGFASALTASGDPLEALLGNYIQKYGIGQGYDLSEPTGSVPFNASYMGDVLQLLSGEQFSGLKGGLLTPAGQTGYQNPVGLPLATLQKLQGMAPNAPTLSLEQLQSIMPEMAALVGRARGKGALPNLLGLEEALAGKLRAAETY